MIGASSLVNAAPVLPAPKIPIASPWRSLGNQRAQYAMPTVNEPPAMPTNSPTTRKCQNAVASEISQIGTTVLSIRMNITMRPPNLSVHIPSGTRISEPVSTGVATRMPNSVSFRPNCCLMGTPMTANIIQIMKQTVNASVLMMTTDHALYCWVAMNHLAPDW